MDKNNNVLCIFHTQSVFQGAHLGLKSKDDRFIKSRWRCLRCVYSEGGPNLMLFACSMAPIPHSLCRSFSLSLSLSLSLFVKSFSCTIWLYIFDWNVAFERVCVGCMRACYVSVFYSLLGCYKTMINDFKYCLTVWHLWEMLHRRFSIAPLHSCQVNYKAKCFICNEILKQKLELIANNSSRLLFFFFFFFIFSHIYFVLSFVGTDVYLSMCVRTFTTWQKIILRAAHTAHTAHIRVTTILEEL